MKATETEKENSSSLRQKIWRPLVLVLVLGCSGIAVVMLYTMQTPPEAAIIGVLIVTVGAIFLVAVLFELREFSIGKSGVTAKIDRVEAMAHVAQDMAKETSAKLDNVMNELLLAYGKETYSHRSEAYAEMSQLLEPLALYFREAPVDYDILRNLGRSLRTWYFKFGMFLTPTSQDRYFFLQDILQFLVLQQRETGELLDQAPSLYYQIDEQDKELCQLFGLSKLDGNEETWKGKLYGNFNRRAAANPAFLNNLAQAKEKHFSIVRCAASALRTQMAQDIAARERPQFELLSA